MDEIQDAKQLEEQISHAFQDVKYPGDNSLLDTNADYEENQITFSYFRGKRWQDLLDDFENLNSHYASVWFLSPQAFHYYLPALLLTSLNWEKADMIGDDVVQGLAPPPYGVIEDTGYFAERIGLLTAAQKSAIYSLFLFLCRYYQEDFYASYPVDQILNYWSRAVLEG